MNNRFEILAPAGDFDNLKAAVFAGADSVYLGVQSFNARASATNFDYETLKEAVKFCHARNVTVNVRGLRLNLLISLSLIWMRERLILMHTSRKAAIVNHMIYE